MADKPKTGIEAIETFAAEVPACTLEQALAKFQGRRTPKTLAAARRMVATGKRVKVPRHLLRQLWRVTGGWQTEWNGSTPPKKLSGLMPGGNPQFTGEKIVLGDLTLVVGVDRGNMAKEPQFPRGAVLFYRGRSVGRIDHQYQEHWNRSRPDQYTPWLSNAMVNGALAALRPTTA